MSSTIVVGFVNSPEGQAAVAAAADEAERRHACLVLVNSSRGGHQDVESVLAVRGELEAARAALLERGLEVEVIEFARGEDPASDLLEVATQREADLVVIGLRRRSPVGKFVLGSNAQQILLSAECAVLAVKAQVPSN